MLKFRAPKYCKNYADIFRKPKKQVRLIWVQSGQVLAGIRIKPGKGRLMF